MDSRALVAYILLWGVLTIYALLAALDFGAGFYRWLAYRRGQDEAHTIAHDFLKPVWEVVNVFLVLLVVGMVGFFPLAANIFGTALLLPFSFVVIVLAVRGVAIGFSHLWQHPSRLYEDAIGLGGLLAPALLVSFIAASESGAITLVHGSVRVSQGLLWLSPLYLILALLAVAATTHLSALLLYHRAVRQSHQTAAAFYRRGALHSGLVTGGLAVLLLPVLRWIAPDHLSALAHLWPLLLLVAMGWALDIWTLARGSSSSGRGSNSAQRPGLLALAAGLSTWGLAIALFGLTRLPWLLYGQVPLDEALTPPAMFTALMVTVTLGMLVLLPSLALLYAVLLRPVTTNAGDAKVSESAGRPTPERTLVAAGSR